MKTPNNSAVLSSLNHQSRFWRLSRLEFWTAGTVSQPWLGAKGRDPAEATDEKFLPVEIEKPGWNWEPPLHTCSRRPVAAKLETVQKVCCTEEPRPRPSERAKSNFFLLSFALSETRESGSATVGMMIPLAGFAISRLQPDPGPDTGSTEWTTGLSHGAAAFKHRIEERVAGCPFGMP